MTLRSLLLQYQFVLRLFPRPRCLSVAYLIDRISTNDTRLVDDNWLVSHYPPAAIYEIQKCVFLKLNSFISRTSINTSLVSM